MADWLFVYRGAIDEEITIPHQFANPDILIKTNEDVRPQLTLFQVAFVPGIGMTKWDDVRTLWNDTHYLNLSCPYPYYLKIRPYRGFQGLNVSIWKASMPIISSLNRPAPSQATSTTIAASTTSVSLLAANANRLGAIINNNSVGRLYIDFDSSASDTNYALRINPGDAYEVPYGYTGEIAGVWTNSNGNALVREFL